MKLSTICMVVCAAAPLLIVITLVVMLSNSRFFSSEPNKFPCLFCLAEDDIGDQYGSGRHAPYPMNYYIPPELVALWPARETYVFRTITAQRATPINGKTSYTSSVKTTRTCRRSPQGTAYTTWQLLLVSLLTAHTLRMRRTVICPRILPPRSNYIRTFEVETIDIETLQSRRLTSDMDWNAMPSWSPDGARIAFIKYGYLRNSDCIEDDRIGLYVMDADGANVRKITAYRLPQRVLYPPIWSPNGDSLAYVLAEYVCGEYRYGNEEEKTALYTVGVDGSGLKLLAKMESLRPPSWSPDGQRIAFGVAGGDDQGAYIIQPDGTDLRQVHDRSTNQVVWSPDGSELLVNGGYIVSADGSGGGRMIAPLYLHPHRSSTYWGEGLAYGHGLGAWSPDGSRVAIYRPRKTTIPEMPAVLFTVASDGADVRVVAVEDEDSVSWRRCGPADAGVPACTPEGASLYGHGYRLRRDYETLLSIRDTVAGDALLNWSPSQPVTAWHGVHVSRTQGKPRVSGVDLDVDTLTGCVPRILIVRWNAPDGMERCEPEDTETP